MGTNIKYGRLLQTVLMDTVVREKISDLGAQDEGGEGGRDPLQHLLGLPLLGFNNYHRPLSLWGRSITRQKLVLAPEYRQFCTCFIIHGEAGFQVSEEAPSFATDSKFGDLLVVVVPNQVWFSPTNIGQQFEELENEKNLYYVICCSNFETSAQAR